MLASRADSGSDGGWMVGIIVYDGDTARTADDLEAAARAAETAQPVPYLFHGQA
jgi:hypothetical protein